VTTILAARSDDVGELGSSIELVWHRLESDSGAGDGGEVDVGLGSRLE
jgi:hypothetical protein